MPSQVSRACPTPQEVGQTMDRVRTELRRRIVGMTQEIDLLLCAVLAGRHVLMEGVPGLGKTLASQSLAMTLGCKYRRIQFTPDMLPADILGGHIYDARNATFSLRRGPIFSNVLLADEINRAPSKTQSALLEVMQERQVTLEGETFKLDPPFLVLATQNPIEHEGVYALPQAQLDRFGIRLLIQYPSEAEEKAIYALHRGNLPEINGVLSAAEVCRFQGAVNAVTVSDEVIDIVVHLTQATRQHHGVLLGASPRLGVDLLQFCRARAVMDGRNYVIPDDIKELFFAVANHRIQLSPRAEISGLKVRDIIDEAIESTQLV